jgi:hypothetical protein
VIPTDLSTGFVKDLTSGLGDSSAQISRSQSATVSNDICPGTIEELYSDVSLISTKTPHIRVLGLCHSDNSDELACALEITPVNGVLRYKAVSYERGLELSRNGLNVIHVNGKPLLVSENL